MEKRKENTLLPRETPPLLQIRARAKRLVDIARDDQRPRRSPGPFLVDLGDVARQVAEEGAGDGVAVLGAVEREDADGAAVRGGDGADVDQRRGGAAVANLGCVEAGE